eukprot:m.46487 g.46487  ORF g.46487 m.46487 type:complete len:51 (-) comp7269_c0_seq2:656-808(-)
MVEGRGDRAEKKFLMKVGEGEKNSPYYGRKGYARSVDSWMEDDEQSDARS